jgi:hypothetical protein
VKTKDRKYKIRYFMEFWDKKPDWVDIAATRAVIPGVRPSNTDYGYTDRLVVASIIENPDGTPASVLLCDSKTGGPPDREILEVLAKQIQHQIEHHTGG